MPAGTANTHVATTAFVATEVAALTYKANLASPAFTGVPTAPTAASGTATTQLATTAFVSAAVGTVLSGFSNMQVFTSSGTFTVPAGVTKVKVTVVGGGGGGSITTAGGGGGAAIKIISGLTPGGTVAVTVGLGGAGRAAGSTAAAPAGGTSSFGAFCSASGGEGGTYGQGYGALGGIGSGGDLNIAGCSSDYSDGTSGASIFGGSVRRIASVATNGRNYGGGGAGGGTDPDFAGGTGAAGVVVVEY